jgi:hypothetical protein
VAAGNRSRRSVFNAEPWGGANSLRDCCIRLGHFSKIIQKEVAAAPYPNLVLSAWRCDFSTTMHQYPAHEQRRILSAALSWVHGLNLVLNRLLL